MNNELIDYRNGIIAGWYSLGDSVEDLSAFFQLGFNDIILILNTFDIDPDLTRKSKNKSYVKFFSAQELSVLLTGNMPIEDVAFIFNRSIREVEVLYKEHRESCQRAQGDAEYLSKVIKSLYRDKE